MATFSWSNWSFGVDLAGLINEALIHAKEADYSFLAQGNTTLQNAEIAVLINQAIDEYFDNVPYIGRTSSTVTLAASTSEYNAPTDLNGQHIERLQMVDGRELQYFNLNTIYSSIDYPTRNGDVVLDEPEWWSYNPVTNKLILLPESTSTPSQNAVVFYRRKATAITGTNVLNRVETPVAINEIPVKHKELLSLILAYYIVKRNRERGSDAVESVRISLAESLDAALKSMTANGALNHLSFFTGPVMKTANF